MRCFFGSGSAIRPVVGAMLLVGVWMAPVAAQLGAELEVERDEHGTTTRLELLRAGLYTVRAERRSTELEDIGRLGFQLPGVGVGLDGYASAFLERRAGATWAGSNFELGRGALMFGGSLERARSDFTGLYVKLRGGDFDLAAGGGLRDGQSVWHGAAYAKGTGYSLVLGGTAGPDGGRYAHAAGTWEPRERGAGPGGWFLAERDGPADYVVEVDVVDVATFNYLTSWGPYGMDQFPHEKRVEALGDLMRYFRPSIRSHARTGGVGVLGGRYEVTEGQGELTLDARVFPARIFGVRERAGARPTGRKWMPYVRFRVLPSLMFGAARNVSTGMTTVRGEIALPPFVIYAETAPTGGDPYVFLQYVLRGR